MPTYKEKLRQLAKHEFRAKHDVNTAVKNIRKVFGYNVIDSKVVRKWFDEFKEENTECFAASSYYHSNMVEALSDDTEKRVSHGMLSQINANYLHHTMMTSDGRFGYAINRRGFVVVDLFHGEMRYALFY
jgi:hypothetical protein